MMCILICDCDTTRVCVWGGGGGGGGLERQSKARSYYRYRPLSGKVELISLSAEASTFPQDIVANFALFSNRFNVANRGPIFLKFSNAKLLKGISRN